MGRVTCTALALLIVLIVTIPVSASVITVPGDQPTIQAGVGAAGLGDTVLVQPGLYTENVIVDSKNIVILGDTAGFGVILQPSAPGVSPVRFVDVIGPSTQIAGFVIQGATDASGLVCQSSSPTIRKNHIRDNHAPDYGGGILLTDGGKALITGNWICRNSAPRGGGVAMSGGSADIIENVIDTNWAGNLGGAVYCNYDEAHVISGNTFRANAAGDGGGGIFLFNNGSAVTIAGNLFVADTSDHGGGIDNSGRNNLDIVNNTFDRCIAGTRNGGGNAIWWAGGYNGSVGSNIFSNTASLNGQGGALGGGGGLEDIDYNDAFNNSPADFYLLTPGPNTLAANPLYCSAETGDYTLQASSPCAGTGDGGSNRGAFGVGCEGNPEPQVLVIQVGDSLASHVTDQTPLISWRYFSPSGGPLLQSEIQVGADNDWTVAELWNPAPIAGPDTLVEYSGQPLTDGTTYHIRIRVTTNSGTSSWLAAQFHMNTVPGAPALLSPDNGAVVTQARPCLTAETSSDDDGDDLTFQFEVYGDPGLTTVVATSGDIPGYYSEVSWRVTPALTLEDKTHYWRVQAFDGFEWGPWSKPWSFVFNAVNDPPQPAVLTAPANNAVVPSLVVLFAWLEAADPDGDITSYTLLLATDANFNFVVSVSDLHQPAFPCDVLNMGQRYWWKVIAYDDRGGVSESEAWSFIVPVPGDLDGDMSRTAVDLARLIDILFAGAPFPSGILAADVNGDCWVDALDLVFFIIHLYEGGVAPGPICGFTPAATLRVPQDYPTIQAAVNAALPADTVKVSPGTYTEDVLVYYKSIVLMGDTASFDVILHPTATEQIPLTLEHISSPGCQVIGFVIENAAYAPGVYCSGSSPTIRKNNIRDNANPGGTGGGLCLENGGMAVVRDNIICRNIAHRGAGIGMSGAAADVIGNDIDSNRAGNVGGGLLCDGESSHVIMHNAFRGNFAEDGGGGVFLFGGEPVTVSYNLFVKDVADHGGGLDNSGRYDVVVDHNTFDQCVAGLAVGGGNAIWWAGDPTGGVISNNIVTNSIAVSVPIGGAIGGDQIAVGLVAIEYNAVWNNAPADFYRFSAGPNTLSADPIYCNPAAGVYNLDPLSPCAGTGESGTDRGAFGAGCGP